MRPALAFSLLVRLSFRFLSLMSHFLAHLSQVGPPADRFLAPQGGWDSPRPPRCRLAAAWLPFLARPGAPWLQPGCFTWLAQAHPRRSLTVILRPPRSRPAAISLSFCAMPAAT